MKYKSLPILSGVLVLLMTGCSSEETILDITPDAPYQAAGIEICGGRPSGLALSRASEPSVLGYCQADKIDFRVYRAHSTTFNQPEPSISDLRPESLINGANTNIISKEITESTGTYGQNRGLNWNYQGLIENYVTAFYIPALAYTEADATLFSCSTPDDPSTMMFSLVADENGAFTTPEVYFGRLSFVTGDKSFDNTIQTSTKGFQWFKRGLVTGNNKDFNGEFPVSGKLYRIVSGLTAQVTDVNPNIVTKMEMYLSNIPTSILLYGDHGDFYPVEAASAAEQHTKIATEGESDAWVKVAENDDMTTETVSLASFLLPSTVGRSMMIRVYFADGITDESGNPLISRDFVIRAPKSVFLTGEDAEVYLSGAPAELKGGNGVYLYNVSANSFYSYSNVRINLKGSFDDFFTSKQEVDFKLEVCPSFDRVHNDIEIDY